MYIIGRSASDVRRFIADRTNQPDAVRPCCKFRYYSQQGFRPTSLVNRTVKVFDVLMINGTSLAQKSLRRRKEVLAKDRVFKTVPGRFEQADLWDGSTPDDIDMRLKDIVGSK
jgi:hypothetical protein